MAFKTAIADNGVEKPLRSQVSGRLVEVDEFGDPIAPLEPGEFITVLFDRWPLDANNEPIVHVFEVGRTSIRVATAQEAGPTIAEQLLLNQENLEFDVGGGKILSVNPIAVAILKSIHSLMGATINLPMKDGEIVNASKEKIQQAFQDGEQQNHDLYDAL